jgi:L-iditol 2-dehydrogenase
MLQAVMTAPGKIEFKSVEVPLIKDGQVLVRIEKIGICGSDIHVYDGKHPYTTYPVVQGHEVSGEIVEISNSISDLKVGDKVTIQPQVVCGKCYSCIHGNYNICDELKVMGFQTTGMASEYVAVDAEKVLRFGDDLNFESGAMIEPLAVAVHAIKRLNSVRGKKILVIGAGPIGNLVAQTAKGFNAKEVMITDLSNYRLEIARQCGIDYCINSDKNNLSVEINNKFGRNKADAILECVGRDITIEQAINNARKGTDIIVVGVFGQKATIDMGFVQDHELRLIGTLMYMKDDYIKAIELLKEGKVKVENLISTRFSFRDYLKAYQYIKEKKDKVMKVMISVREG